MEIQKILLQDAGIQILIFAEVMVQLESEDGICRKTLRAWRRKYNQLANDEKRTEL